MDEHAYYTDLPPLVSAAAPEVPTVTARRILTTRTAALFHPNACPDVAGNLWLSATELTGNSTPHKVWKAAPGQAVPVHVATVWPADAHKGDGVTMRIVRDPVTGEYYLLLLFTTHAPVSGERDNDYQIAEVRGLGIAAPATGEGLEFDSRALGQGQDPQAEPVDYAHILRDVTAQVDRLAALFGGGNVRTGIQEKVEDGAVRLFRNDEPNDPRPARFLDALSTAIYNSPGLYNRLRETLYEVLRDNGLIPPDPRPPKAQ